MSMTTGINEQLVSCKVVLETSARTWEIELTPGPRRPEVSIDVDHNHDHDHLLFGGHELLDSNVRLTFDRVVFKADVTDKTPTRREHCEP